MSNRKLPLQQRYLFLLVFFGVLSSITLTSCFKFGWTREPLSGNADLLCLYTAVQILHNFPPSQLYDINIQRSVQQQFLKNGVIFHGGVMLYVHPPFEALWFYPLGWLTYPAAYWVWFGINLASLVFLPMALTRIFSIQLMPHLVIIFLATASYLPFIICLYRGQDSILFLWIILAAIYLFKKDREFAGGFVLGLAFFRFHLAYLIVFPLLIKLRKKGLFGLSFCLGLLVSISGLMIGIEGIKRYLLLLKDFNQPRFASGFNLSDMHCWPAQIQLWGFQQARNFWCSALIAVIGAAIIGIIWRRRWDISSEFFEVNFAATLLAAFLASPYLYMYDGAASFLAWVIGYRLSNSPHLSNLIQGLLVSLLLAAHLAWIFWPAIVESWGIQPTVFIMSGLLFVLMMTGAKHQKLCSN